MKKFTFSFNRIHLLGLLLAAVLWWKSHLFLMFLGFFSCLPGFGTNGAGCGYLVLFGIMGLPILFAVTLPLTIIPFLYYKLRNKKINLAGILTFTLIGIPSASLVQKSLIDRKEMRTLSGLYSRGMVEEMIAMIESPDFNVEKSNYPKNVPFLHRLTCKDHIGHYEVSNEDHFRIFEKLIKFEVYKPIKDDYSDLQISSKVLKCLIRNDSSWTVQGLRVYLDQPNSPLDVEDIVALIEDTNARKLEYLLNSKKLTVKKVLSNGKTLEESLKTKKLSSWESDILEKKLQISLKN